MVLEAGREHSRRHNDDVRVDDAEAAHSRQDILSVTGNILQCMY